MPQVSSTSPKRLSGGAVRSRFRAARLYDDASSSVNFVIANVHVVGYAFSTRQNFVKPLTDSQSGEHSWTTTWEANHLGTYALDAGLILQSVAENVDEFIDEYLRVER